MKKNAYNTFNKIIKLQLIRWPLALAVLTVCGASVRLTGQSTP